MSVIYNRIGFHAKEAKITKLKDGAYQIYLFDPRGPVFRTEYTKIESEACNIANNFIYRKESTS